MEISFTPGLSASSKTASVFENDPRDIEETTMDKYIRKERERKQRRKERMKARREGRDPDADADDAEPETVTDAEGAEQEDLGFDDPFFTNPMRAEKEMKKAKHEAKAKRKAEEAAEAAASATQRADLELLMAGEEEDTMRHFDMRDVRKAEKAKASKHKKKKSKGKIGDDTNLLAQEDDFKMDTQDPRFARMFESHEFAIDPTNPRFKKTEGMKKLMEEGRRKRANGEIHVSKGEAKKEKRVRSEDNDLGALVEKVKKRTKT
jgi:hypothetical protein